MEFYKETRFKNSEIGEVPEDWEVIELKKIAEVVGGFAFPLKFQGKNSGKYPFIKVNDLNTSSKYIISAENYIDNDDLQAMRVKTYPPDTIIFPKIGMAVYLNKFRILKTWGTFDNNIAGIIPKRANSEYLYYYFQGRIDLRQLSAATTMPSIKKSTLENLKIPLPPLEEQKKIAEVLSNTDKAIQKVDESIEKFEKLKKGLMNILLNGKVRIKVENGKIYFYKETKFKNSEIGEVPEDWEVVRLGDIAKVKRGASPRPKGDPKYFGGSIPWIKISDISKYKRGFYLTATDEGVTEEGKKKSVFIRRGTLLLTNSGTVGVPVISLIDGCIHDGILAIYDLKENIDKIYLYYIFEQFRSNFDAYAQQGTQKNLNTTIVREFQISLPPLEEQKAIAEILSKIDKVIQLKKEKKEKLQKIKKYFMDNLLTGKVRIKQ